MEDACDEYPCPPLHYVEEVVMDHFPLGSCDLPFDILLHITSYIPAEDLLRLSQVNRYLNEVLGDVSLWGLRAASYYPKNLFPLIDDDERTSLQTLRSRCVKNERLRQAFRDEAVHMNTKSFPVAERGHRCNALTFMNNGSVLVTGGNDHRVTLWNLNDIKDDAYSPESGLGDAGTVAYRHGDWVTSLCVWRNSLSSGSMDRSIRLYDVEGTRTSPATSLGEGISLNISMCVVELVEECCAMIVTVRISLWPACIIRWNYLTLESRRSRSCTNSSRKPIVFRWFGTLHWSATKPLSSSAIPSVLWTLFPDGEQGYRISADGRNCWVGSNSGSVFLYDTQSFEIVSNFSEVFAFSQCRVVGLHCDDSHVLACSADGSAKMLEPTKDPAVLWEWKNASELDLRTLAFANDCSIAISSADRAHIWWPG